MLLPRSKKKICTIGRINKNILFQDCQKKLKNLKNDVNRVAVDLYKMKWLIEILLL